MHRFAVLLPSRRQSKSNSAMYLVKGYYICEINNAVAISLVDAILYYVMQSYSKYVYISKNQLKEKAPTYCTYQNFYQEFVK